MIEKTIKFLEAVASVEDPIGIKVIMVIDGVRKCVSGLLEKVEIDGEEIVLHFSGGETIKGKKRHIRRFEIYQTKSGRFIPLVDN